MRRKTRRNTHPNEISSRVVNHVNPSLKRQIIHHVSRCIIQEQKEFIQTVADTPETIASNTGRKREGGVRLL